MKTTDGWEQACEFDRGVNYVHVYTYITQKTLFLKCTRNYMNMCATDGKFVYPVVMLMIL